MSEARPGPFPTTRWTLILSAQPSPEARRAATAELLALYWRPLYLYARRKGLAPDASEDAVQAVCVRLLERDFVKDLDPARGKLRGYLRACLDHVVVNAHAREAAKRRGGEAVVVPLDREVAEQVLAAAPAEGPESFDREWAECVMGQAMERLEDEFRSGKRGGPFELVTLYFGSGDPPPYADAARRFGMSPPQLKAFLHRARARFRELVEQIVADTVDGADAVAPEATLLLVELRS